MVSYAITVYEPNVGDEFSVDMRENEGLYEPGGVYRPTECVRVRTVRSKKRFDCRRCYFNNKNCVFLLCSDTNRIDKSPVRFEGIKNAAKP